VFSTSSTVDSPAITSLERRIDNGTVIERVTDITSAAVLVGNAILTCGWDSMSPGVGPPVSNSSRDEEWAVFFDALSNRYRRRLLVALLYHNPQDDDDLQVPDDVVMSDEDAERLELNMVHQHLPKLLNMGFIEWNSETKVISTGPTFEEILPLLVLIEEHRDELPDGWI
jgi:hypothetical protein